MTIRVVYVEVTPTISNSIQPIMMWIGFIAIGSRSSCNVNHNPVASVDRGFRVIITHFKLMCDTLGSKSEEDTTIGARVVRSYH